MNVNEYGIVFAFSTAFDMSAFTDISISFVKPSGATLVVTNPDVTVPAVPVNTTLGTFAANEYVAYTFQAGDVDETGDWACRVIYDDGAQHLISDVATFSVDP